MSSRIGPKWSKSNSDDAIGPIRDTIESTVVATEIEWINMLFFIRINFCNKKILSFISAKSDNSYFLHKLAINFADLHTGAGEIFSFDELTAAATICRIPRFAMFEAEGCSSCSGFGAFGRIRISIKFGLGSVIFRSVGSNSGLSTLIQKSF